MTAPQDVPALLREIEALAVCEDTDGSPYTAETLRALAALVEAQQAEITRMRDALSLAESVYRKNVVATGEPSTVLDALQTALRQSLPAQPATPRDWLTADRHYVERMLAESEDDPWGVSRHMWETRLAEIDEQRAALKGKTP